MFESNLDHDIDIRILPLIDVIFFLLVFFMLFTTFKTSPMGINIDLPKAETVTDQKQDKQVTVNISREGKVSIGKDTVKLDDLSGEISNIIAENSTETLFIINADKQVAYEEIIKIVDKIRRAGGYRLALAADREETD